MKKSIIKLNNTGKKIKMKGGGGEMEYTEELIRAAEEQAAAEQAAAERERQKEQEAADKEAADKEAADKEAERKKAAAEQAAAEQAAAERKRQKAAAARRLRIAANAVQATKIMEALNEQTNKENDERRSLSNDMNQARNLQVIKGILLTAKEKKNQYLIDETLDYIKIFFSKKPFPIIINTPEIEELAQELQAKFYSESNKTVYNSIFEFMKNIVTNIHTVITNNPGRGAANLTNEEKDNLKRTLFNQLVEEFRSDRSKSAALDKHRTGNDPSGSRGRRSIGRGRRGLSRSRSRGRRSGPIGPSGSSGPIGPSVNSPGLNRGPIGPSGTSKPRDLSAELSNLYNKKLVKKNQINRSISDVINHEAIKQTISSEKLTYGESSLKNRINEFKKVYLETNADLETIVDELERLRSDIIPRIDKEYKREISTQISNIIKNIKELNLKNRDTGSAAAAAAAEDHKKLTPENAEQLYNSIKKNGNYDETSISKADTQILINIAKNGSNQLLAQATDLLAQAKNLFETNPRLKEQLKQQLENIREYRNSIHDSNPDIPTAIKHHLQIEKVFGEMEKIVKNAEEAEAATRIQAIDRGRTVRKRLTEMKERKQQQRVMMEEYANIIQKFTDESKRRTQEAVEKAKTQLVGNLKKKRMISKEKIDSLLRNQTQLNVSLLNINKLIGRIHKSKITKKEKERIISRLEERKKNINDKLDLINNEIEQLNLIPDDLKIKTEELISEYKNQTDNFSKKLKEQREIARNNLIKRLGDRNLEKTQAQAEAQAAQEVAAAESQVENLTQKLETEIQEVASAAESQVEKAQQTLEKINTPLAAAKAAEELAKAEAELAQAEAARKKAEAEAERERQKAEAEAQAALEKQTDKKQKRNHAYFQ